jgi:hypothetical protein
MRIFHRIPILYRLARRRGLRRTTLVAEAVTDSLLRQPDAREPLTGAGAPPPRGAVHQRAGRARGPVRSPGPASQSRPAGPYTSRRPPPRRGAPR